MQVIINFINNNIDVIRTKSASVLFKTIEVLTGNVNNTFISLWGIILMKTYDELYNGIYPIVDTTLQICISDGNNSEYIKDKCSICNVIFSFDFRPDYDRVGPV